jgi:hypothetical protein
MDVSKMIQEMKKNKMVYLRKAVCIMSTNTLSFDIEVFAFCLVK